MRLVVPFQPSATYTTDYVSKIIEFADCDVEVMTEHRWPGWWSKLGLFDPRMKGDFLACDLDTIIVGSLSDLLEAKHSMMLRDFFFPHRAASGVMFLTERDRARVWDSWIESPTKWMARFRGIAGGGDGAFISQALKPAHYIQDEYPGQVCSFKVDCRGGPPKSARLICYHGNPRPHRTGWATDSSNYWRGSIPPSALKAENQG